MTKQLLLQLGVLLLPVISFLGCPESEIPQVTIGDQVWTAENLNVVCYQNGDSIPEVKSFDEWNNLKTGAWCYYENEDSYGKSYQRLYNIYALKDKRGLAPEGWHIPSNDEWNILVEKLGGNQKAATEMKSKSGWNSNGNGNNSTGLNCLPGGLRSSLTFSGQGNIGVWWTSSIDTSLENANLTLYIGSSGQVITRYGNEKCGMSVRCIKNRKN